MPQILHSHYFSFLTQTLFWTPRLSSLLITMYFTSFSNLICLRLTSKTTSLNFIKKTFLGFSIVNNGISAYTITMAQWLFAVFKCLITSVKCSSPPNPNLISFHHHHQYLSSVGIAPHLDCGVHLLIHLLTYSFLNLRHPKCNSHSIL